MEDSLREDLEVPVYAWLALPQDSWMQAGECVNSCLLLLEIFFFPFWVPCRVVFRKNMYHFGSYHDLKAEVYGHYSQLLPLSDSAFGLYTLHFSSL